MQAYRFRGKKIDGSGWAYGSLVTGGLFGESLDKCWIFVYGTGTFHEVVPETVGMWTGLKDKNGKEIYEGDILKSFSFSVPSYEVFNDRGCYRLRYKLRSGDWNDWGPLFRMEEIQWEGRLPLCPDVIGNIHDHPHLLTPSQKGDVLNTMNTDPNLQAAPANQEAIAEQAAAGDAANAEAVNEQANAQESAAQDAAVGATEE